MARWNSALHPRDEEGKFKGKGGGGRSRSRPRDPVTLVGRGRGLRYSRTPTGGEVARTIASSAARGAILGAAAGPKGALVGGGITAASAAGQVLVLSRRTAKARRR